jgi:hypothetical protein
MNIERVRLSALVILLFSIGIETAGQISPGDLSSPHSHLEGMSNCTQCHVLGNKVSNDKCLTCHTEVQSRIASKRGYHSSSDVNGKECISCHSDHNGKNFQLIRLNKTGFDHSLTGFTLSVPHSKKDCADCHTTRYITDEKLKGKKLTYMGLNTSCLTCHADYHRKELSSECLTCHNPESFKPVSKFNHNTARFTLSGRHKLVECVKCHKISTENNVKYQKFKGIQFSSCVNCHTDPHQNKFGQDCKKCHDENSFKAAGSAITFDHSKTNFNLADKHLTVSCQSCHKTKFTDPLKHEKCTDCHRDYHNGQFTQNGVVTDCSQCHTTKGYTLFSFSIEQHNQKGFILAGAHEATPCIDCHKKGNEWNFRNIGKTCVDCHKDIHKGAISEKFYPASNCKICHKETNWNEVTFNHSSTGFPLSDAHATADCRLCHFKNDEKGISVQKFSGLSKNCADCHTDKHYNQFEKNGITDCTECHDTRNWKASKFNHSTTRFKLDGKHINLACAKCHKPQPDGNNSYIKYKLNEFKCESCHL